MTLYLDLVLFLNFFFDFLLLLTVSVLLKRNVSTFRLMCGAFLGGFSILLLFTSISNTMLFFIKFLLSILLIIFTFSYQSFSYTFQNILYFYSSSFLLGGGLYALSYNSKHEGLLFLKESLSINMTACIVLSPFLLYLYVKQWKRWRTTYQKYYEIQLKIGEKKYRERGFLDTGNRLCDPISKKPVVLMSQKKFQKLEKGKKFIFVPYKTITESGILKCIFIDQIHIEGIGDYQNILLGEMKDHLMLDGVDMILNEQIWEG